MDSDNWTQKNPALADAVRHFPKLVFREWLKLRRQGADDFFPGWRGVTCKRRRVKLLDDGALLKAALN